MEKTRDARGKALDTAERLFRTQGYSATGLTQILEESGAPKGSFYFHFPQGKQQLAREVLDAYGNRVRAGLQILAVKHKGDPAGYIRAVSKAMAREMEASGWALGCAAQNLANELTPADEDFTTAVSATFSGWIAVMTDAIRSAYASRAVAERRAIALLAALEGAKTLARSMRSAAPFDAVTDMALLELRPGKAPRG
jgi:TetR/AcrR family transcriptional regulator, lmrAB and yxaGH operons repressor